MLMLRQCLFISKGFYLICPAHVIGRRQNRQFRNYKNVKSVHGRVASHGPDVPKCSTCCFLNVAHYSISKTSDILKAFCQSKWSVTSYFTKISSEITRVFMKMRYPTDSSQILRETLGFRYALWSSLVVVIGSCMSDVPKKDLHIIRPN